MYRFAVLAAAAGGLIACAQPSKPTTTATTPPAASAAPAGPSDGSSEEGRLAADTVIASWKGGKLTYGELTGAHASELRKLRNKFKNDLYNVERQRLEATVVQKLVQAKAKAKGQTEEQYVDAEVGTPTVTDKEVKDFHQSNPRIKEQPFDQLAPRIRSFLEQQKKQEAMLSFFERVKKEAGVEINLPRPQLEKAEFDLAGRPSKGKDDAKVTIVEFSDFQCPYCSKAVDGVEALLKAYPDDVRVVFMHYPLSFHKEALPAAIASQCANAQGKFWSFHDQVFANQSSLTAAKFEEYAKGAGLDMDKYKACVVDPKTAEFVRKDMDQGNDAGVEGTPSFFINGEPYSGGVPSADAIKSYLEG